MRGSAEMRAEGAHQTGTAVCRTLPVGYAMTRRGNRVICCRARFLRPPHTGRALGAAANAVCGSLFASLFYGVCHLSAVI